mgnify:CR=1 FL=1
MLVERLRTLSPENLRYLLDNFEYEFTRLHPASRPEFATLGVLRFCSYCVALLKDETARRTGNATSGIPRFNFEKERVSDDELLSLLRPFCEWQERASITEVQLFLSDLSHMVERECKRRGIADETTNNLR